jgi:hypothetical protein
MSCAFRRSYCFPWSLARDGIPSWAIIGYLGFLWILFVVYSLQAAKAAVCTCASKVYLLRLLLPVYQLNSYEWYMTINHHPGCLFRVNKLLIAGEKSQRSTLPDSIIWPSSSNNQNAHSILLLVSLQCMIAL